MVAQACGGSSRTANLCLSCPLCNSRKGTRTAADFIASGDWKLAVPPNLPSDVGGMLAECFGWGGQEAYLKTGTHNATLVLRDGSVFAFVRANPDDGWRSFRLGDDARASTVVLAWVFLRRHHTPRRPKPPRRAGRRSGARPPERTEISSLIVPIS